MVEAGLAQPIDLFAGDVWQQIARLDALPKNPNDGGMIE